MMLAIFASSIGGTACAHAYDPERDTWLLPPAPDTPAGANRVVDPLAFSRMQATGNDREPVYADGRDADLIHAAASNVLGQVEVLLKEGVNPNGRADLSGGHALLHAVSNGNVEMVRLLLDAGADTELAGQGFTPLGLAASRGHAQIVRLLLLAGADVNRVSSDGNTPITAAAGMNRIEVVRELIAYRPDYSIYNQDGLNAMGVAALEGFDGILELMLVAGADPNELDRNGNTALFWASFPNRQETMRLLVRHGGKSG